MWLPLPTAQGYKGQALRVLNKTFFKTLFLLIQTFNSKNFYPKTLTALPTPQQLWLSFFFSKKNNGAKRSEAILNWIAMSTFELKTHQIGRTYSNPHFFILNKGLNSGKPLLKSCANCFVVTTTTEELKHTLFHLSMMLQIGGFYAYYLKGSVIQFISIDDCRSTLKNSYCSLFYDAIQLQKHINIVSTINKKEKELHKIISKMADLKVSYIQSLFSKMQKEAI